MSRVLIIEDETSIAELEKDYMELSGFDVDSVSDGEEGLQKKDPLIQKMYEWICSEYDSGRVTMISDSELETCYMEYSNKKK